MSYHVPGIKPYYTLCCCQEWLSVWSAFSRNELLMYLSGDRWLGNNCNCSSKDCGLDHSPMLLWVDQTATARWLVVTVDDLVQLLDIDM